MKILNKSHKGTKIKSIMDSPACRVIIDDMDKRVRPVNIGSALRLKK